jgi:hypothetical protein
MHHQRLSKSCLCTALADFCKGIFQQLPTQLFKCEFCTSIVDLLKGILHKCIQKHFPTLCPWDYYLRIFIRPGRVYPRIFIHPRISIPINKSYIVAQGRAVANAEKPVSLMQAQCESQRWQIREMAVPLLFHDVGSLP